MRPLSFALSGAMVSTLFGFPAPAPEWRIRELVCRGAADIDLRFDKDPSPWNARMIRFVLRYTPGHQPVGYNYENLTPGSCSWNPGNFPKYPVEPGIIYIDVEKALQDYSGTGTRYIDTTINAAVFYPDAVNLPRYLKSPDHYWKFYVNDSTNISHSFLATKHNVRQPTRIEFTGPVGQSTDRAGTGDRVSGTLRDAAPTLDAAQVPLTFREVVRKPTQYWIRFGARARAGATVEYGIVPPIRKSGRLTFHQPYPWAVRTLSEKGFAGEYSTAPLRGLVQGKKYYFVINVPAGGRGLPAQEYSGEFWTLAQHVTVRFTRIDVLNDSDKLDSGEIVFEFHLAAGDKTWPSCSGQGVCRVSLGRKDWETGSKNPIDITLSQAITTPVARIWVSGIDSDTPASHTRPFTAEWTTTGHSNDNGDRNNARAQLTFTVAPEQTVFVSRNAFKLRSFDGFVLMYEVHGQAEATWR